MARMNWATPPSTGNAELDHFLSDLLEAIRDLDRQGLAAVAAVTETAGGTYGANEQAMLAALKAAVNGILTHT